ncbi:Rieske (2Fe-2S) protein [Cryobacterium melibiosiphilum]|uniref:Cytochrome bc1 complex Rieske iron-sulfur subunit n=1 Tax=Cryobacterium melibiosiphilum TaxID=995039 RepID=A0A3A5M920_9MICO|nr:Rieske (2Fe-2S) protein [Cryobacterium melibiosiphilum]RJT84620.1 Rieske (2Fe-2S) protein [Cryobacterium melibiosiphilum]
MTNTSDLSRRSLLVLGGVGSALALAACAPAGEVTAETDAASPDATASSAPEQVATLADIPVGGGIAVMVAGQPVLLSQPTAGEVVAFSAVCPHQGCTVAPASSGFECPCHQSKFDGATGEVLDGPSPRALDPLTATVDGESVLVG